MGKDGLLSSFRNISSRMLRPAPDTADTDPLVILVKREVDEFKEKKPTRNRPEFKVPSSPRETNLSASFKPTSEKHLNLLRGCLSFIGDMNSGKIEVKLNPEFLEWLKAASPDVLKEAYFEAVYLVCDTKIRPVDVVGLVKQAGVAMKWSRDDLISLGAMHLNSLRLLHEYAAIRDARSGPSSREEYELEYKASTADGNLECDFKHFKVAGQFAKSVKENDLHFFRDSKVSIAALKRLRIAFLKSTIQPPHL
jgi:hypothetical protein